MELFDPDGGTDQHFQLEHVRDGYYKIITICNKVISVNADYADKPNHYLYQTDYVVNDNLQLWNFTKTVRNSYIIRPKSGKAYTTDFCMAASTGILTSDGRNVEQREYTADTDYKDEWYLSRAEFSCWYSDENEAFYWPTLPKIYIEDLTSNKIFYFQQGVDSAIAQWENALSIDLEITPHE